MTIAGFESLHDLLDAAGFSVRLFASPGGSLRAWAVVEVDGVISEMAMPTIDGLALQRLVREARPTLLAKLGCPRIALISRAPKSQSVGLWWRFGTPVNQRSAQSHQDGMPHDRRAIGACGPRYIRFVLIEAISDQEIFIRSRNFAPDGNSTTSSLSKTG
jgi:CheY-like chemotaxis protein